MTDIRLIVSILKYVLMKISNVFLVLIISMIFLSACQESEAPLEDLDQERAFMDASGKYIPVLKATSPTAQPVSFNFIAQGSASPVEKRFFNIANNEQELAVIWNQIHSNFSEPPAMPKVNFGQNMAIFIFSGPKTTGGYGMEVVSLWEDDKNLVFGIKENNPGDVATMALTNPYIGLTTQRKNLKISVKFIE